MKTAEAIERIAALKARRNAVILAHNYQRPEIQDAADFVGDSLELSRCAANTDAEVIVFCGVHFMAETAAILCPDRKVLLPDAAAGCPMADMVTPEGLRAFKRQHPGAVVACYVNSSAAVKAESDVCCTSSNAARVVLNLDGRKVLFVPDRYLGGYVRDITGRNLLLWPGFCPTHMKISRVNVLKLKHRYPGAHVVVHPECQPEVRELADAVLSTGGICRYAGERSFKTMIVGTEMGILHRLRKENPYKTFVPASMRAVCPNMKRITLEKLLRSLETLATEVTVPEEIRARACRAVAKMFALTEHGGADRRSARSSAFETRDVPPAAVQHGGNPSR